MDPTPHPEGDWQGITGERLHLARLFFQHTARWPDMIIRLGATGGSPRRYYQLSDHSWRCIGTAGDQAKENAAFWYLTDHFLSYGLPVPEVFAVDAVNGCYLQQDLGDLSLYDALVNAGADAQEAMLEQSLQHLVQFQTATLRTLDFSKCYPGLPFDRVAARWDLDYMKYMFLRVLEIEVDEQALEIAFDGLLEALFTEGYAAFMYRDFQSRNIMLNHGMQWFIDYQGGRLGPPAYDAASLLYQTRIALPHDLRQRLTSAYASMLAGQIPMDQHAVVQQVHLFAVLRLLQTLGAYGFRGIIQRKEVFVRPIRSAIQNTLAVIRSSPLADRLGVISDALSLAEKQFPAEENSPGQLTVTIHSFSFLHGIPDDPSGHGGGFVFDCRALPNPHHQPEIRPFTGRDEVIIAWLKQKPEVDTFLSHADELVTNAIIQYLDRGFSRLQVNFGCTGGKHRSVYCAEQLSQRLNKRFKDIVVNTVHVQLDQ